jgi:hypothetical protein
MLKSNKAPEARPSKKWVVGDQFFEIYSRACSYVRNRRKNLTQDNLVVLFEKIMLTTGVCSEMSGRPLHDIAVAMAEAVVAQYDLKLRK